jgi:malate/lactate dehydrogenase
VSLGVPVVLADSKVREIVELPLEPAEHQAVEASAASIRDMIEAGRAMLASR